MNTLSNLRSNFSARIFAALTITALVVSALPAHFFVAIAANADAVGTISVDLLPAPSGGASEYFDVTFSGTGTLNLDGWTVEDTLAGTNIRYTFSGTTLTNGQTFRVCSSTANGTNCDAQSSGGSVWNNAGDTLVLRDENASAQVTLAYTNAASDAVVTQSESVNFAPVACTPQFDSQSTTYIQNTNTGDYFDTVNDALADCDTTDGDTIMLSGDITTSEPINLDRPVIFDGGGNVVMASFSGSNNEPAVVYVTSDTVTVQNVTIDGTSATNLSGLLIQSGITQTTQISVVEQNFATSTEETATSTATSTPETTGTSTSSTTDTGTGTSTDSATADEETDNSSESTGSGSGSDETSAPSVCSYEGVVVDYSEPAYQKNGNLVSANRRATTAVQTVAPYVNFYGKEGSNWNVTPLDFFTLGIGGEVTYEFTDKVALDHGGDDIAIWEITGGNASQQTKESLDVYVSDDGINFEKAGSVVGDGSVSIGGTSFDFVKFVKLVDTSQNTSGDGYDLDAITIIDDSCGEEPSPLEVLPLCSTFFDEGIVITQEEVLLSHDAGGAFLGPEPVNVPAGYYDVNVVSFDFHSIHTWDTLELEQWFINGLLNDIVVFTSATTPDIPDNVDAQQVQLDSNVYLENGLDAIQWVHGAYPNGDYHSVHSLCVQFLPVVTEEPAPDTFTISGFGYEKNGTSTTPYPGIIVFATNASSSEILSTTTDSLGYFSFSVPTGTWTISETVPTGYTQHSTTQDGTLVPDLAGVLEECTFTVTASTTATYTCDFVNVQDEVEEPEPEVDTFTISGYGLEIASSSTSTTPYSGLTVYARNTITNALMSTTTDSLGYFSFSVATGTYEVYETVPTNWSQVLVEQNGTLVPDVANTDEICTFTVTASTTATYTCDFTNQPDPEETVTTQTSSSSGGSSSGTRTRTTSAPAPTPQVLGATTSQCPFLFDYMQMGITNDPWEVTKLQLFLNIFVAPNPITGFFGTVTDTNVKLFQERYREEVLDPWYEKGIVYHNNPTGFVYKTTLWKINDIVCPDYAILPVFEGESTTENIDLKATPVSD